jgi:hypothetical protein
VNDCLVRTCNGGFCGTDFVPVGPAPTPIPGDCKAEDCDGAGVLFHPVDDADLPVDNNACTEDLCDMGTPANPPLSRGTSCGADLICDGTGVCVGCVTFNDCPGFDNNCRQRTCVNGVCGVTFAPDGTVTTTNPMQVSGNCQLRVCDGMGNSFDIPDDSDPPAPSANQCIDDPYCSSGAIITMPSDPGDACGQGGVCNGFGNCVECVNNSHCTPPETCILAQYQCACIPESNSTTCANKACGNATNNCGVVVNCPVLCGAGEACNALTNQCTCQGDVASTGQACPDIDEYSVCNPQYGCQCGICTNQFLCGMGPPSVCYCSGSGACTNGGICMNGKCTCNGTTCAFGERCIAFNQCGCNLASCED